MNLTTKEIKSPMDEVSEEHEKIWSVWVGKYHNMGGDFEEVWPTYSKLSDETGISENKIKSFIADCRKIGISYHSPTVNGEEGLFKGSGNFIKSKFQENTFREALEKIKC